MPRPLLLIFRDLVRRDPTPVASALPLSRALTCLQVDCVNSLTFPTADVVKTNGRSEEALEETSGSERDAHCFCG